MHCANCGAMFPEDASFCPYCGEPVSTAVEENAGGPPPREESAHTAPDHTGVTGTDGVKTQSPGGEVGEAGTQPPDTGGDVVDHASSEEPGGAYDTRDATDYRKYLRWWSYVSVFLGIFAMLFGFLAIVFGLTAPGPGGLDIGGSFVIVLGLVYFVHAYYIRQYSAVAWWGGMIWYGFNFLGSLLALDPFGSVFMGGFVVMGVGFYLGWEGRSAIS